MFALEEMLSALTLAWRIAASTIFRAVSTCIVQKQITAGNTHIMALERKRYHEQFVDYQRSLERATSHYSRL